MPKVLVVDDDRHNQLILQQLLNSEGYQVELADNGQQGLEVARRCLPDLVISDIMMPEMNGFRFCRELKQDPQLRQQPFIFYTATFVEKEDEELAMSLGASRFVIKPQDNLQFLQILGEVLENYQQGRLVVPREPQASDEKLLTLYESSMGRKLEEAIDRLQKEQRALKLSEQRLKEAQEIAHLGHWQMSLKDRQLSWSDEIYRILGLKLQQPAASFSLLQEVVAVEDRPLVEETIAAALERMTSFDLDFRLQLQTGEIRYVQLRGQVQCDDFGNPSYAIGTLQDISDRKLASLEKERLRDELFQAQKMESLGRLAGGVAHDFNNMLAAISGNAQLMALRLPNDDPMRRYLDVIQDASQKAAGLVRQLLGFSSRQVSPSKQVNLNLLILDLTRMFERVIGERIAVDTDLDPELCALVADQSQIEQVIMNLAINARDSMPEGGRLRLATANRRLAEEDLAAYPGLCAGDYVLLSVADSGCGISAEHQKLIFDPFFTTKSEEDGTGLGLATVYTVIKQHEGHVWVESSLQKGTAFHILLPCSGSFCPVIDEQQVAASYERGSETVLLVEDQALVREVMRAALEELGYQVLDAADGLEAESVFAANPQVDLLLTDVVLPRKGGCELAVALQKEKPELKLIYMSGHTLKSLMEREGLSKEAHFINKPVSIDELAQTVRQALDE